MATRRTRKKVTDDNHEPKATAVSKTTRSKRKLAAEDVDEASNKENSIITAIPNAENKISPNKKTKLSVAASASNASTGAGKLIIEHW